MQILNFIACSILCKWWDDKFHVKLFLINLINVIRKMYLTLPTTCARMSDFIKTEESSFSK